MFLTVGNLLQFSHCKKLHDAGYSSIRSELDADHGLQNTRIAKVSRSMLPVALKN